MYAIRTARRTGTVTGSLVDPCNADAPSTLQGRNCICIYYPNDSGRRPMAPAVVTAQARVRSQASPSEICGRQSGTETGCSPSTSVSSVGIIPPMLRIHLHLGRSIGNFKQTTPLRLWEEWVAKVLLHCFQASKGSNTVQVHEGMWKQNNANYFKLGRTHKTFKTPVSLPCIAKLMIRQDT